MKLLIGETYLATINKDNIDGATLVGTVKAIRGNKIDFKNVMLDKGLGEHYYKIMTIDKSVITNIKKW